MKKEKITFITVSVLMHLYLFSAFSLSDLTSLLVPDIRLKPSYAVNYIMVRVGPVTVDNKMNYKDIRWDERLQKILSSPNVKRGITEKIDPILTVPLLADNEDIRSVARKRVVHPKPAENHRVLADKTFTISFLNPSRETKFLSRIKKGRMLTMDTNSQPRHRDMATNPQSQAGDESELQRYAKIIKDKIDIIYPKLAKMKGLEGDVQVKFLISRDGKLKEIKLTESTRHRILKQATVETIRRAAPFPPLPPATNKKELWLSLTISFKLEY